MNDSKVEIGTYRPLVIATYMADKALAQACMLDDGVYWTLCRSLPPALATVAVATGTAEGEELAVEVGVLQQRWVKAVGAEERPLSIALPSIRETACRLRALRDRAADGQDASVEELWELVELLTDAVTIETLSPRKPVLG